MEETLSSKINLQQIMLSEEHNEAKAFELYDCNIFSCLPTTKKKEIFPNLLKLPCVVFVKSFFFASMCVLEL